MKDIKITPLLDTLRLQKISDEEYFSEQYSDYVSNSRLGLLIPNQYSKSSNIFTNFLLGFKGNRIFSDSLSLGTLVHEQILQPEYFDLPPNLDRPTGKVGFIADEIISINKENYINYSENDFLQACKIVDYYGGNPTTEKIQEITPKIKNYLSKRWEFKNDKVTTFVDDKILNKAKCCIEALKNNNTVKSLLSPKGTIETPISECEQAILLDVKIKAPDLPEFIIRLKSKLDNYTIDKDFNIITVNDVKTIGRTVNYVDDQIIKYNYYREMYMYCTLLSLCCKKFYNMNHFKVESNFLWVSTVPDYYTKVTTMTSELFNKGRKQFKYLLRLAAIALYFKDGEKALNYYANL